MKKLLSILILFMTFSLSAQEEILGNKIELNISILSSPSLIIERDYSIGINETDIGSSNSLGYSLSLRYMKSKRNFDWIFGFEFGLYSIKTNLYITDDFRHLGWGGYTDESTNYPISFVAPEIGVKYIILEKGKNKLTISGSILASYHVRSSYEFTQSAILDNGSFKALYYSEFINNNNHRIVIAPKLDLKYQYKFKNVEFFVGFSSILSNQTPFLGSFEIYGDTEVLRGVLKKQFILSGLNIGCIKELDK